MRAKLEGKNEFVKEKMYLCRKTTLNKLYMKVFVNDTEVRTYYGAKVKSVVLAYCRANNLSLKLEDLEVKDAFGNRIGLDGALHANSKIYIK